MCEKAICVTAPIAIPADLPRSGSPQSRFLLIYPGPDLPRRGGPGERGLLGREGGLDREEVGCHPGRKRRELGIRGHVRRGGGRGGRLRGGGFRARRLRLLCRRLRCRLRRRPFGLAAASSSAGFGAARRQSSISARLGSFRPPLLSLVNTSGMSCAITALMSNPTADSIVGGSPSASPRSSSSSS